MGAKTLNGEEWQVKITGSSAVKSTGVLVYPALG
jgi:hypothetical protein